MYTKSLFLSNIVQKSPSMCVTEHFSFIKLIHPPHKCGWLERVIIAQVYLRLPTTKGHAKCAALFHSTISQMSLFLRKCSEVPGTIIHMSKRTWCRDYCPLWWGVIMVRAAFWLKVTGGANTATLPSGLNQGQQRKPYTCRNLTSLVHLHH